MSPVHQTPQHQYHDLYSEFTYTLNASMVADRDVSVKSEESSTLTDEGKDISEISQGCKSLQKVQVTKIKTLNLFEKIVKVQKTEAKAVIKDNNLLNISFDESLK